MAPESGEERGTHARPDQPDVPSFARMGCALNIVLSPQRTAGQARYLCEKGRQFLVCRTRPVPPPAPVGAVQRSWRKRETHLLRVTMMRPERNMPEVPRPSVGFSVVSVTVSVGNGGREGQRTEVVAEPCVWGAVWYLEGGVAGVIFQCGHRWRWV